MKKVLMCIGAMVLCAGPIALTAYAEGEIKSDVQAVKAQAGEIKEDACHLQKTFEV